MSKITDALRKHITRCLEEDVVAKRVCYIKAHQDYCDSLMDFAPTELESELKYKRTLVAKSDYGNSVRMLRLWQNQKQSLI